MRKKCQNHSDDGDLGCNIFEDICYILYFDSKLLRIEPGWLSWLNKITKNLRKSLGKFLTYPERHGPMEGHHNF